MLKQISENEAKRKEYVKIFRKLSDVCEKTAEEAEQNPSMCASVSGGTSLAAELRKNQSIIRQSISLLSGKWDEETAQKIIAALENESIKYETYFKLIIATGMRRGECCALQWQDIDREQLNIHSLRHTAASLMIAGGADMATVAGILSHSQLSATLDNLYPRKNKKSRQRRIARDA